MLNYQRVVIGILWNNYRGRIRYDGEVGKVLELLEEVLAKLARKGHPK